MTKQTPVDESEGATLAAGDLPLSIAVLFSSKIKDSTLTCPAAAKEMTPSSF